MNFNGIVFPAPPPTYSYDKFSDRIFFVRRSPVSATKISDFDEIHPDAEGIAHIPVYYSPWYMGASKVLIYFHGNAEDLGRAEEFLACLTEELQVHVIAMEYPGYGIYPGTPDADRICDDAVNVYDYLVKVLKWEEKDIILFGRSIGSGPATHVAALRNPGMLILMSAFTSIKDVAKHNVCAFSFMVADRLRNIDKISAVTCPKIFIHGLQDNLVPAIFSERLYTAAKEPKKLSYSLEMTHNAFDMWYDLVGPVKEYWTSIHFNSESGIKDRIKFTVMDTELPSEYKEKKEHWSCSI